MDREFFYKKHRGLGVLDYEKYLNLQQLFNCQKPYEKLSNPDELQFMIVHQVEELWMKLIMYSLLDINEMLIKKSTNSIVILFKRVHGIQQLMIDQLSLLETMSPKSFQEFRVKLGSGSGQDSPGFSMFFPISHHLWKSFLDSYLGGDKDFLEKVYQESYNFSEAFLIAEQLIEFDELFRKFLLHHLQLVERTLGRGVISNRSLSTDLLAKTLKVRLFPSLWDVRFKITEEAGEKYGKVRSPLSEV